MESGSDCPICTLADGVQKLIVITYKRLVSDNEDVVLFAELTNLELGEGLGGFTRRHYKHRNQPVSGLKSKSGGGKRSKKVEEVNSKVGLKNQTI